MSNYRKSIWYFCLLKKNPSISYIMSKSTFYTHYETELLEVNQTPIAAGKKTKEEKSEHPEKSMSEDEMDEYYENDYDDEEYVGASAPLDDDEIEFDIENEESLFDDLYEDDYEDYDPNE